MTRMSCSLQNLPVRLLAFFIFCGIATAATALDLTHYMPLNAGNQWSYQNNNYVTRTDTIGSPVVLPSGVSAIPWATVKSNETGYSTEYYTNDSNGLRTHQFFDSSVFVSGYGNTSSSVTFSPAISYSPANPAAGSVYTSSGTSSWAYTNVGSSTLNYSTNTQIIGFETVTNYSGTQSWSAIKVILSLTVSGTVNGQFISTTSAATYWLADGIGVVQMYSPNSSGVMETWKLTSTNVVPPKSSQTIGAISFSPTTLAVGGTTTASATATSGLAVSFSSVTPSVCTVSGNTVAGVASGVCTIAANQAGNASYHAAAQVTQNLSVIAQTPAVSLSPASLAFANQNFGVTSAAQVVTLTNSGTGALSIISIAASGDFAQANNCGTSVAAGASCTLSITSTPTVAGVRNGTVTITSNAATSPSIISVTSVPTGTPSFVAGWNLAGNSVNAALDVATAFSDTSKVTTVWKWIPATSKWAFYAPSMTAPNLAAYAANKGYEVLATINGGEGFWVNAKTVFAVQLPAGTALTTASFQDALTPPNPLRAGWSLISVGGSPTPAMFNNGIGLTPPATGAIATNLTTLWAWDSAASNWYFYAPSLDANGALASYIAAKNYLHFGPRTLDPAMGFWVNRPASAGGGIAITNAAEGFWVGTSSAGFDAGVAVLENGETWGIYSYGSTIYGALLGSTTSSGNSLNGAGSDYNIPARTVTQGTYSGTVTPKTSIAITSSGGGTFNGTYRSLYDQSPSLASLAGTYSGYGVSGTSTTQYTTVTVSPAGVVSSGLQALGCTASGSVAPRASGKNVYNLSVTFAGINCALGDGTTTTGIAILDTTVTPGRLYAVALKPDKTDGFVWSGTR